MIRHRNVKHLMLQHIRPPGWIGPIALLAKENRTIWVYLAAMMQLGKTLLEDQLRKISPDSERRVLGFRNCTQLQHGMQGQ